MSASSCSVSCCSFAVLSKQSKCFIQFTGTVYRHINFVPGAQPKNCKLFISGSLQCCNCLHPVQKNPEPGPSVPARSLFGAQALHLCHVIKPASIDFYCQLRGSWASCKHNTDILLTLESCYGKHAAASSRYGSPSAFILSHVSV